MSWTLQGAGFLVYIAFGERSIVMGTTVFDPEQLAGAIDNGKKLAVVFDYATITWFQF